LSTQDHYDLVVIGGGINGVGIAADGAGRGLSVLLCEQHDLACATSSSSSKLIHGGLRYLEQYDFRLVKESLNERKILTQIAPHLIQPLCFLVPMKKSSRPFWLIRLGLFFYDLMGKSKLFKQSQAHFFNEKDPHNPLHPSIRKGFSYTDCITDDARLVITNALRAKIKGAKIKVRTKCISAKRLNDAWHIELLNETTGTRKVITAKALVNAAGPWVEDLIQKTINLESDYQLRLVKGSHILVNKLYEHDSAYLLQHTDGRVIFVVPYCQNYTMIGTTDIQYQGNPLAASITPEEISYLCQIVSDYFNHPIGASSVVHSWSGVRGLVADNSAKLSENNRGYQLELITSEKGDLPLINVFGGKLTTYRKVAEDTLNLMAPFFTHCQSAWTATEPVPGGDLPENSLAAFLKQLNQQYPWLPLSVAKRYSQQYGTLTHIVLKDVKQLSQLGLDLGHGLYEKELVYMIEHEWARSSEDILWRRTKLGLKFTEHEKNQLELWLEKNLNTLI
jgi:glycerol-3-phosphate dehydrogenase